MGQGARAVNFRNFGRKAAVAALLATTAVYGTVAASTVVRAQTAYTVPGGPLNRALASFGSQSGTQISYDATIVRDKSSNGVKGATTREQAIAQLLQGTGLIYAFTDATSVLISARAVAAGNVAADGSTVLETITVQGQGATTEGTGLYTTGAMTSATGLTLSARDTPQSVSVVTSQRVQDANAQSLTDMLKASPGIYAEQADSFRSEPFARGFYIDRFQYDGVTVNIQNGFYGDHLNDSAFYDRAEIVRGAPGLLSGAGNPSASVNFVRKRADATTAQGSVTASVGSWNNYRGILDYATPLNQEGTIRGRFVGIINDKDSFIDRDHVRLGGAYGTFEFDLTENTLLTVGADYQKNKTDGAQWGGIPVLFSDGTPANLPRSTATSTNWSYYNSETWNAFARLEHTFDNGWKLRGDYLHRDMHYDAKMNFFRGMLNPDGSGLSAAPSYLISDAEQSVANLTLSGQYQFLGREHEFTAGLTRDRAHEDYNFRSRTFLTPIPNFLTWDGSMPEPGWNPTWYAPRTIDQDSAYAATRISLVDGLHAIVGARYTKFDQNSNGTVSDGSAFVPYASLSYDLSQNFTVYASYTDIFRPQTALDRNGAFLDPVEGKNYEVGLKGEFLDGRINASVALFRTLQDNVAVPDVGFYIPGTPDQAYIGAKGVTTKGIEAEIGGELAPGWTLSLSGTYQESEDIDGARVNPNMPRASAGIFTTWDMSEHWEGLTLGGGVRWHGSTSYPISTTAGTVNYRQSSFAVVDLMAKYDFSENLQAQLNIGNVFDTKYFRLQEDELLLYGAPRNVTFTLKAKF